MKIDSHQHFWKYNEAEYGWMGEEMEKLKRDHLPGELAGLLEANSSGSGKAKS
jgi:L-fuconolactonase